MSTVLYSLQTSLEEILRFVHTLTSTIHSLRNVLIFLLCIHIYACRPSSKKPSMIPVIRKIAGGVLLSCNGGLVNTDVEFVKKVNKQI